jgi:hypothetical protein
VVRCFVSQPAGNACETFNRIGLDVITTPVLGDHASRLEDSILDEVTCEIIRPAKILELGHTGFSTERSGGMRAEKDGRKKQDT